MSARVERAWPRDVYDAMESLSAATGGIGAGRYFDGTEQPWQFARHEQKPCCIMGHALELELDGRGDISVGTLQRVLGVTTSESDAAVVTINRRKQVRGAARVSFAEWAAEMNIVRGDR